MDEKELSAIDSATVYVHRGEYKACKELVDLSISNLTLCQQIIGETT